MTPAFELPKRWVHREYPALEAEIDELEKGSAMIGWHHTNDGFGPTAGRMDYAAWTETTRAADRIVWWHVEEFVRQYRPIEEETTHDQHAHLHTKGAG